MTIEGLYSLFKQHPEITTDSRRVVPGCLFFALKGARFDGNQFAAQALERGAAFAIVDDPELGEGECFILVEDALSCLQQLAGYHRRQFDIPLIALTGSNGKTTTKELMSAVLSGHYKTHATPGNFNNHIGLPLSLLAMPAETEVAIIEMGANHLGEIDFLCRIAEPTHGLITNIGKAHLEGFGSLEGVKKAKSELYRYLAAKGGMVFLNQNEPYLEELASCVERKFVYRQSEHPDETSEYCEIQLLPSCPFVKAGFFSKTGDFIEVKSRLIGGYNFKNMMVAIALGKYFKVPATKIKAAIEAYIPSDNRSQILRQGSNTIILDAYNANPGSMKEALLSFSELKAAKKIAILGDMLELGSYSEEEHQAIVKLAAGQGITKFIFVGPEFEAAAKEKDFAHFSGLAALKSWWEQQDLKDSYILIKGSRGMRLESII